MESLHHRSSYKQFIAPLQFFPRELPPRAGAADSSAVMSDKMTLRVKGFRQTTLVEIADQASYNIKLSP